MSFRKEPIDYGAHSHISWLNSVFRRIRDSKSGLPTSLYRTEVLKPDILSAEIFCPQGHSATILDPRFVFTNGSADFGGEVHDVSCIESNPDLETKILAVICEPKTLTTKVSLDDPRHKCGKSGQVCLPKCCQVGEVFNVMKMICEEVNSFFISFHLQSN